MGCGNNFLALAQPLAVTSYTVLLATSYKNFSIALPYLLHATTYNFLDATSQELL